MVQNIKIFELSNYSYAIYWIWTISWDDTSSFAIAANTENKQNKHVRSEVQIQWFT
jgi:hypothetical protein